MKSSSKYCPHLNPLNFGRPQTTPDEKLEFVEHVLGVLIDSRFGEGSPYMSLAESSFAFSDTQLFANVTLLTAAEIETHLKMAAAEPIPFYAMPFLGRKREKHLRQRVVTREGVLSLNIADERPPERLADVLSISKPPAHAGGSPLARGSPTFLGRAYFADSASLA